MQPTHIRVVLSGVSASTSLACWVVLLLPQLIEQWRLGTSEGISPVFIIIWFLGDLCNLIGSVWANLLPGVILLAVWFCVIDILMFASYMYYKYNGKKKGDIESNVINVVNDDVNSNINTNDDNDNPTKPLLERRLSNTLYTSSRRKSSKRSRRDSLVSIINTPATSFSLVFQKFILPILFVIFSGFIGYLFSDSGVPSDPSDPSDPIDPVVSSIIPEILGYVSAALYLGARIPQIIQNHQKKSVYGLSLLFFIFSMLGNISYSGSILFYSTEWDYVKLYIPWLLGSLGTVFEDLIIMAQFWIYGSAPSQSDQESAIQD